MKNAVVKNYCCLILNIIVTPTRTNQTIVHVLKSIKLFMLECAPEHAYEITLLWKFGKKLYIYNI